MWKRKGIFSDVCGQHGKKRGEPSRRFLQNNKGLAVLPGHPTDIQWLSFHVYAPCTMAMSVDGHRHQREDQPTAIATKASEARGIFGDNDDTCRLLSPKMMALSKTVETMCIFQPCRGSRRTEPGRKDTPGNLKCFCRKFGHFLSTTPKTGRAGGITSANGNLSTPVLFHQPIHRTLSHTTNPNLNRARSILQHARRCRSRCTLAFHLPS